MVKILISEKEHFEKWVRKDLDKACWLWTGHVNSKHNGYGRFARGYKRRMAHVAAYEIFKGPIPKGLSVCHRCDTPLCVNPEHLFLGTHQENMRDAKVKGRFSHKLTDEQINLIRNDKRSSGELAKILPVSARHIRSIRQGKKRKPLNPSAEGRTVSGRQVAND